MDEPGDGPVDAHLAVVIVHGMGEQRPRDTLVPFTRMLLPGYEVFPRPTRVSDSYEARRHYVPKVLLTEGPTDVSVFEYHWSYRMKGNRLRDLGAVAYRTVLPTDGFWHLLAVVAALGAAVWIAGVAIAGWPLDAASPAWMSDDLIDVPRVVAWSLPVWAWQWVDLVWLAVAVAAGTVLAAVVRGVVKFVVGPAPEGLKAKVVPWAPPGVFVVATSYIAVRQLTWPVSFSWTQAGQAVFAFLAAAGVALFVALGAGLLSLFGRWLEPVDRFLDRRVRYGSPPPKLWKLFRDVWGWVTLLLFVALLFWPYSQRGAVAVVLVAAALGSMVILTPHGLKVTLVLVWAAIFTVLLTAVLPRWDGLVEQFSDADELTVAIVVAALTGSAGVAAAVGLVLGRVAPWLTTSFVDVVRYVDTSPRSYEVRRDVQKGLVELLHRLHKGEFSRIVVVAHSLGSYIAYDAISSFWFERVSESSVRVPHFREPPPAKRSEDHDKWRTQFRKEQADAFANASDTDGPRWLVSDFVTFGSPMYMAHRLVTKTRREFEEGKKRHDFFTCPPPQPRSVPVKLLKTLEDDVTEDVRRDLGAFGVVRWTNLWYRTRLGFFGDPFGGRLAPLFGAGIEDRAIPDGWRSLVPFGAHALYTKSADSKFAQTVRETVLFQSRRTDPSDD